MIEKEKIPQEVLPKLGVIFIGRRRPGFDMEWGKRMEGRLRGWLRGAGFPLFEPPEKAVDDGSLRRAVQLCNENGAEALVILQTTMGDGRLAPTLAQLWPDPPLFWATPENPEGDMISSCSLVGTHLWATTFRQMGHPFEVVYGDPDAAETQQRLVEAARIAATVRKLKRVRLGMIGGQAPGFFTMSGDPFAIHQGLGAQMQTFSLLEFADVVKGLSEKAVAEDVAKAKALGLPHKDTTDAVFPMDSRLYLAMRHFLDAENLDALTIRCWPEMPNTFGQWPYLALARLIDEGRAVACEGDADGALTNWIGESLGMGRCYLTDWLEHDHETITLWHGGAAPMGLCPPAGEPGSPRIALHFNSKKPTVVEASLRENMPVTLLRFWRYEGGYHLTAREGTTIKPKRALMGTNGLARLTDQDPGEWFETLCDQGMPHHLAVFEGHHAAMLKRLGRALQMKIV
ncbi:MAG TPA: L-fucose/L-arabinose isomerase family protein [Verrucomicrobiae bacterium]|jgi:L-fucose isomerase-like protein|nr:L-fucose/L-arabinose isomerase family protein [Verrucomicrobiae bacterium]